ncbi:MAG: LysM peptidoglycan-binding domain-containing protein [Desulfobacula sp.]|uniref:LysM peptidoglycan-binding domain-containing protein n=1 Tax=Desulfobacula sp. TaxID=2593537 RepID=UPI0025C5C862|nr:LysM peptidoglycan-binding domain-containing protein [Desulfobacula sp.]MCD4720386.1 LysM peptidoglycan-binding domain-containing protein [Desulfobacula sp.]
MQSQKTMIAIFVLTFWGFAFCSTGFAQDDKEFIPGENSGFYYTIKKGDTLWDLSQKFYNSQWDWPGLWELNDDIKNPHWIYPGKKIQIFLKKKIALKPKIVKVQKVEKKIVPVKVKASFSFSQMDHIGFIKKKAHPSLGNIIKEQDGSLMMSTNDIIFIKPSGKGTLIPGRVYHIFTTHNLKEKIHGQTFIGVKHLIKAQVKILEHKVTYVKALITNAYRAVYKDDLIMEYYKRDSILTVQENPNPIDARIICSEDNNIMVNDYTIAFIDTGKAKVTPGQIYSILRENETKDHTLWQPQKKESIKLENLESGKLIVLHTEDISSTVMIMSSSYAIYPDDMVN